MRHGKAELNVSLDLTRVCGRIKAPELHRSLGENRMEIQTVVSAGIVVRIAVSVISCVPDVGGSAHVLRLIEVEALG